MDADDAHTLTEERVRTVVREQTRLLRKLRRMPGANSMLPVPRMPDTARGETIIDVALAGIPEAMRALMREIEGMNADRERITTIYLAVMKYGDDTANAGSEVVAVMACRADIESEWPKIAKLGLALEKVRRANG
jgi:hypothetical protein